MELVRNETDILNQATLHELAEHHAACCISFYMPTHRRGRETEQDPIRLKNLLSEVETELAADDMRRPEIDDLLAPLYQLIDDRSFWQQQSEGLVIFRSKEWLKMFRLPIDFSELTIIGERPHIKPLLPFITKGGQFYLLTLSQNQVRLFKGTQQKLGQLSLGDTPTSLDEAMRFDEFDDQLQFHTQTGTSADGGRAAVFHGHSNAGDEAVIKENIKRFLHRVDEGVRDVIGEEQAPLVLAGVDMICGLYREISKYPALMAETIAGNVEHTDETTLHEKAWSLVEGQFMEEQQEAIDAYLHLAGNDDGRADNNFKEIVSSAYFQRIDTLFIPLQQQKWGNFDKEANAVHLHQEQQVGDTDLLDFAAIHTLLNGGSVYALEPHKIPNGETVAAIYRYG